MRSKRQRFADFKVAKAPPGNHKDLCTRSSRHRPPNSLARLPLRQRRSPKKESPSSQVIHHPRPPLLPECLLHKPCIRQGLRHGLMQRQEARAVMEDGKQQERRQRPRPGPRARRRSLARAKRNTRRCREAIQRLLDTRPRSQRNLPHLPWSTPRTSASNSSKSKFQMTSSRSSPGSSAVAF